jgi:serine/threonine-protein kinase RsbT
MHSLYSSVLAVLSKHVSPLNAEGALEAALRRRGLSRTELRVEHLSDLLPDLQRAVTLFRGARPTRLRDELLELTAEAAPSPAPTVRRIEIRTEDDIVVARSETRKLCEAMGAGSFGTQRTATVVAELARNIVAYTPGGTIEVEPKPGDRRLVCIRAQDRGRGIPNLSEIMSGRYRSHTGLGLGLLGTKRLSERFDVQTGSGGTRIDVEVRT